MERNYEIELYERIFKELSKNMMDHCEGFKKVSIDTESQFFRGMSEGYKAVSKEIVNSLNLINEIIEEINKKDRIL